MRTSNWRYVYLLMTLNSRTNDYFVSITYETCVCWLIMSRLFAPMQCTLLVFTNFILISDFRICKRRKSIVKSALHFYLTKFFFSHIIVKSLKKYHKATYLLRAHYWYTYMTDTNFHVVLQLLSNHEYSII